MLSVLTRNTDFRRLFFAELLVFGADWFIMVPLLVLLSELTGKGLWGGLVLATETGILALLLPYAGTIADRFDRKRILTVANLAAVAAVGLLFAVRGPAAGPIALVAMASLSTAKAFYTPAANSSMPNLVDGEDLPAAMAIAGSTWGTMAVVGSSLGGVLSGLLSPYACFGVVGVALLAAALMTSGIKRPTQRTGERAAGPERQSAFSAMGETLRYLRSEPRLLALVTVKSAIATGNGLLTVFPLLALSYGVGAQGLGLMFAARGAGSALGPFLFRRVLNRPRWLLPGLALSMSAYSLSYLGVAAVTWFPLVLVGIFFAHAMGGGNWTMSNFALAQTVPDQLRGRVNATDTMVAMLAVTLSQLVVGLFVDSVNIRVLIACCALTTLTYAIGWRLVTRRIAYPAVVPAS